MAQDMTPLFLGQPYFPFCFICNFKNIIHERILQSEYKRFSNTSPYIFPSTQLSSIFPKHLSNFEIFRNLRKSISNNYQNAQNASPQVPASTNANQKPFFFFSYFFFL